MFKKIILYTFAASLILILMSCGASTGSRYSKTEEKKESKEPSTEKEKKFTEDFDLKNYHSKIEVAEKPVEDESIQSGYNEIWYEYTDTTGSANGNKIIVDKKEGFRIQVYSTDDLDDANNIRSELYFKTNRKNVYVIFDPPFYKVRVGDFLSTNEAGELNFKLTQLGYTESRIVKDSVNVYQ